MINIAPILPQAQPTNQPQAVVGDSQGSESIFGKMFRQVIASGRQSSTQTSAHSSSSPRELPCSEDTKIHTKSETDAPDTPDGALIQSTASDQAVPLPEQPDSDEASERVASADSSRALSQPAQNWAIFPARSDSIGSATHASPSQIRGQFISSVVPATGQQPSQAVVAAQYFHSTTTGVVAGEDATLSAYFSENVLNSSPSLTKAGWTLAVWENTPVAVTVETVLSSGKNGQQDQVAGLSHLAAMAGKSPLTLTDGGDGAVLAGNNTATETGRLMVSLQQLTNLSTAEAHHTDNHQLETTHSLHQTLHEQFASRTIETTPGNSGEKQFSATQQSLVETVVMNQQDSATNAGEQSQSFTELSQGMAPQTPSPGSPASPQQASVVSHPSPLLHANAVLQQIAERVQLRMQELETRLNIKLQPAELGKLDISLIMKEGSIRAHVVAQSGQVQEILERNMTRLKSILESQGFSIEELVVSTESDTINNPDSFHDQLPQHQPYTEPNSQISDTAFDDHWDDPMAPSEKLSTGVNITA